MKSVDHTIVASFFMVEPNYLSENGYMQGYGDGDHNLLTFFPNEHNTAEH